MFIYSDNLRKTTAEEKHLPKCDFSVLKTLRNFSPYATRVSRVNIRINLLGPSLTTNVQQFCQTDIQDTASYF